MKHAKRHPLIFGTLILTITGLITRIIGFFYRIYLSRLFGEEGMGIYQLLSPALSLSFSLTAAGYQTAISKFVAANTAGRRSDDLKTLLTGASITLPLSLGVNAVLFLAAEPIGIFLLKEARTISMLRILSFSIPLPRCMPASTAISMEKESFRSCPHAASGAAGQSRLCLSRHRSRSV